MTVRLGDTIAVSAQPVHDHTVDDPEFAKPGLACRVGDSDDFYAQKNGSTCLFARVPTVGNEAGMFEELPVTVVEQS